MSGTQYMGNRLTIERALLERSRRFSFWRKWSTSWSTSPTCAKGIDTDLFKHLSGDVQDPRAVQASESLRGGSESFQKLGQKHLQRPKLYSSLCGMNEGPVAQ